ncbi:hypothetical protein C8R45DRAFT_976401 [Mycena sanguinolenta]|nr:hypothetical protein C8R45DRAFT_976401 [Mycena sanguinolenta]
MIKASQSDAASKVNKKKDKNVHDKENCRPLSETEPPQQKNRSALEQVHCTLTAPPPKRKSRWDVCVKVPKTLEWQDSGSLASTATIRKDRAPPLAAGASSVLRPTNRVPASQPPHQSVPPAPTISRRETTSEQESLRSVNMGAAASLAFPPLDYDEVWTRAGTCTPMEISPLSSPTTPTKCLPLLCGNGPSRESAGSPTLFMDTPKENVFRGESNGMRRGRSDSVSATSSMAISASSSPTKFIFGQFDQNAGCRRGETPVSQTTGLAGDANTSTFWPGQTVVFKYRRPLRPVV